MLHLLVAIIVAVGGAPTQTREHQLCRRIVSGEATPGARAAVNHALLEGCEALRDRAWERAVAAFERAVAQDSTDAVHHFWLARGYGEQARRVNPLRAAGMFPKIRAHVTRAIAIDPAYVDARVFMIEMLLRAPAVMGGSVDAASEQVDALGRVNAYAGVLAGTRVAFARGDSAGAERALRALTRSHADSAAAYVALLSRFLEHGRTSEAVALIDELDRSPGLGLLAAFYRGHLASVTGQDLEAGAAALRRYTSRSRPSGFPSHAVAHLYLSRILSRQGRTTEARAALVEAVRLDPELEEAKRELERLPRKDRTNR